MRERDSVSRWRRGISCDCEPGGSQCLQDHKRLRNERVRSSTEKKCGKENPKRCESSMSSKSKVEFVKWEARMTPGKKVWYVQNGWKHERIQTSLGTSRLVSATKKAVLGRNQGPSAPRDVDGRVATLNLIRVKDPFSVFFLANVSFADLKSRRNRVTISFYVATPRDLRRKRKIWSFSQESKRYPWHESSVCNTCEGRSQQTRSSERRIGAMVVLESNVEDVQCSLERWRHFTPFQVPFSKRP